MPDLRYHVVSLISVFLALAVGVLLGAAISDRGVISDQLQAEVTNIEDQLEEQRREQQDLVAERDEEISDLEQQTGRNEELLEAMSRAVIPGALTGVNAALVTGPWTDAATVRAVEQALADAGADFTPVPSLPPPQNLADFQDFQEVPQETTDVFSTDPADLVVPEYEDLAREVLDGEGESPDVVVFVGGGEPPENLPEEAVEALETAQSAMFGAWDEDGVRIVAAEPLETERSEIPLFQDAGLTSVDNADTPAGAAAVVVAADTEAEGSYGVKETASQLFPERD